MIMDDDDVCYRSLRSWRCFSQQCKTSDEQWSCDLIVDNLSTKPNTQSLNSLALLFHQPQHCLQHARSSSNALKHLSAPLEPKASQVFESTRLSLSSFESTSPKPLQFREHQPSSLLS